MHALRSPRRSTRPARSLWLALLCALSLLGLQGLGQWHGIAHAAKAGTMSTAGGGTILTTVASSDLWGHAIGDADCHVFDHLSHDHGLVAAPAVACDQLADNAPALPVRAGAELAARFKRGARGPPSIS